jgi:TorA maturation chaperone TorD
MQAHPLLPMTESVNAVMGEEHLRARTYSLLSQLLYGPPDGETLTNLAAIDPEPCAGETLLVAAWRALANAATRAADGELEEEYQSVFIGIGQGEVVPYASWYLTGFLMEQPLAKLRSDLRVLGIEREPGVCEPEDHAAALCATMALLADDASTTIARQHGFFERHVAPWLTRFFRDLQQAPSARFYRAVGQLGERFIELERQAFAMSLPPAPQARQTSREPG